MGDFSTMWFLQLHYPDLGVGLTMSASSNIPPAPIYYFCPVRLTYYFLKSGSRIGHVHGAGDCAAPYGTGSVELASSGHNRGGNESYIDADNGNGPELGRLLAYGRHSRF